MLSVTHPLKESPYSFSAITGNYDTRFELLYSDKTLGIENQNKVYSFATITNNRLHIESSVFIQSVSVYDISGKLVKTYQPTEMSNSLTTTFNYASGVYIAKIKLADDSMVTQKLINE